MPPMSYNPLLLLFLAAGLAAAPGRAAEGETWKIHPEDTVKRRTSEMEMYKCSDCHSETADFNPNERVLKDEHDDKRVHFGEEKGENEWCFSCHKQGNYNRLKRKSGKELGFNQSYVLCGACHGEAYRDWKLNIHGRRVGFWNGAGKIASCAECHDPHDPAFKAMKPEKPPAWPRGKKKRRTVQGNGE